MLSREFPGELPSRKRNVNMFSSEYQAHRSNGGVIWTLSGGLQIMNDTRSGQKPPAPTVLGAKMMVNAVHWLMIYF